MKTIGVILSGCGYLDGAEIRESVLTLYYLDKHLPDARVRILAPDLDQLEVINHVSGEKVSERRNMLIEAARIARGKVEDLGAVKHQEFDGVVLPGGAGVAKNLSTFALRGASGMVLPEVRNFLEALHASKKPIAGICIAPALLALVFGKEGLTCTIGHEQDTIKEISQTGARHRLATVDMAVVDEKMKIVTTPAYMFDEAHLRDIGAGIENCIKAFARML